MSWDELLSALGAALATAYPDEASIQRLGRAARLDLATIQPSGTSIDIWGGVITEAQHHGVLERLVAIARSEDGSRDWYEKELEALKGEHLRSRSDAAGVVSRVGLRVTWSGNEEGRADWLLVKGTENVEVTLPVEPGDHSGATPVLHTGDARIPFQLGASDERLWRAVMPVTSRWRSRRVPLEVVEQTGRRSAAASLIVVSGVWSKVGLAMVGLAGAFGVYWIWPFTNLFDWMASLAKLAPMVPFLAWFGRRAFATGRMPPLFGLIDLPERAFVLAPVVLALSLVVPPLACRVVVNREAFSIDVPGTPSLDPGKEATLWRHDQPAGIALEREEASHAEKFKRFVRVWNATCKPVPWKGMTLDLLRGKPEEALVRATPSGNTVNLDIIGDHCRPADDATAEVDLRKLAERHRFPGSRGRTMASGWTVSGWMKVRKGWDGEAEQPELTLVPTASDSFEIDMTPGRREGGDRVFVSHVWATLTRAMDTGQSEVGIPIPFTPDERISVNIKGQGNGGRLTCRGARKVWALPVESDEGGHAFTLRGDDVTWSVDQPSSASAWFCLSQEPGSEPLGTLSLTFPSGVPGPGWSLSFPAGKVPANITIVSGENRPIGSLTCGGPAFREEAMKVGPVSVPAGAWLSNQALVQADPSSGSPAWTSRWLLAGDGADAAARPHRPNGQLAWVCRPARSGRAEVRVQVQTRSGWRTGKLRGATLVPEPLPPTCFVLSGNDGDPNPKHCRSNECGATCTRNPHHWYKGRQGCSTICECSELPKKCPP